MHRTEPLLPLLPWPCNPAASTPASGHALQAASLDACLSDEYECRVDLHLTPTSPAASAASPGSTGSDLSGATPAGPDAAAAAAAAALRERQGSHAAASTRSGSPGSSGSSRSGGGSSSSSSSGGDFDWLTPQQLEASAPAPPASQPASLSLPPAAPLHPHASPYLPFRCLPSCLASHLLCLPSHAAPPLQAKLLIDTVLPFDATTFNIAKLRSGAG